MQKKVYLCSQIWMIMGKKKNLPVLENITITGVAAEGKALAKIEGMVIFVPNCVPGDVVDLQVTKKKHSFMEARVIRIVQPSEVRCEAKCKHFGVCGGCKWQILPYEEQIDIKIDSLIPYEVMLMKNELTPILEKVSETNRFYVKALEYIERLKELDTVTPDMIPETSLLREFIG